MANRNESFGAGRGANDASKPIPAARDNEGNYVHPVTGMRLPNNTSTEEWEGISAPVTRSNSAATDKPQSQPVANKPEVFEEGIVGRTLEDMQQRIKGAPRASVAGRRPSERAPKKNADYYEGIVKAKVSSGAGRQTLEGFSPKEALPVLAAMHKQVSQHVAGMKADLLGNRDTRDALRAAGTGMLQREYSVTDLDNPDIKGLSAAESHLNNAAHHLNGMHEAIRGSNTVLQHAYSSAAAKSIHSAFNSLKDTNYAFEAIPASKFREMDAALEGQNRVIGGGVIKPNTGEFAPKKRANKEVNLAGTMLRRTPGVLRKVSELKGQPGISDESVNKVLKPEGTARLTGLKTQAEVDATLVSQGRKDEDAAKVIVEPQVQRFGGRRKASQQPGKKSARAAGRVRTPLLDSEGNVLPTSSVRTPNTTGTNEALDGELRVSGARMPRPEDVLNSLKAEKVGTPTQPAIAEVTGQPKQTKNEKGEWVPVRTRATKKTKSTVSAVSDVTGRRMQVKNNAGEWVPATRTVTTEKAAKDTYRAVSASAPTSNERKNPRSRRDAMADAAATARANETEANARAMAAPDNEYIPNIPSKEKQDFYEAERLKRVAEIRGRKAAETRAAKAGAKPKTKPHKPTKSTIAKRVRDAAARAAITPPQASEAPKKKKK